MAPKTHRDDGIVVYTDRHTIDGEEVANVTLESGRTIQWRWKLGCPPVIAALNTPVTMDEIAASYRVIA